jgi:hypothetical protein
MIKNQHSYSVLYKKIEIYSKMQKPVFAYFNFVVERLC